MSFHVNNLKNSFLKHMSTRFEKFLEQNRYQPYKDKYLTYKELRSMIHPSMTEDEEQKFRLAYDSNINEVFCFIQFKYEDLLAKLNDLEDKIKLEKGIKSLVELQDEMYAFAEFIRINIEGFKLLISKHDSVSSRSITSNYKSMFKKKIEDVEGLNKLIYRVSRLKLKTLEVKSEKENNLTFIRKTNKYWVHPENLYSLKLKIVKNLPLYVFTQSVDPNSTPFNAWDHKTHDTCVSSVYFDNINFDLYMERLYKNQGAEAIRIRWYGSTIPSVVFIERKRHEDKWTGFRSKKLRFKIAEKKVVDFLNGEDVWEHVKMLNGDDVFDLYKEIQSTIVSKKLRPIVRTFYKRTAFQLPNDSSVRISLDTNLCMIRECSNKDFEANQFPLKSWVRPDVVCEWPFKNIPREDLVRFPYAVLEVKTQGLDETKPEWIEEIINSSFVEHVHKYSKFMHGCAVLYKSINTIPYWLPQMATDIRKHPYHSIKPIKILENNKFVNKRGEDENNASEIANTPNHGKKIGMPTRVEPKVFFANERTFLKWVQFAIFLGGVGTAILGLGEEKAIFCGTSLMVVAIIFILYALYIFNWRKEKIRTRFPGPYDDLIGPTILVGVFLLALFLTVVFKYPGVVPMLED